MATQNSLSPHKKPVVSSELPFGLNEGSVSEWINNLPVGDKIETCKMVFAALQNFNRHSLDIKTRFQILENFRTLVFLESSYLTTRVIGAAFPLERKARKIAKLAAKFHSELASGYQLIADDRDYHKTYSATEQACVLHRMATSIGISLLRIAQMYESPSSKAWHLLKKIFTEAETKQLMEIKIQDPMTPGSDSSTISGRLGSIVLFSAANPYRYSQSDMDSLFKLFTAHGEKLQWHKFRRDQCRHSFGIDLQSQSLPQHGSSVSKIQSKSFREIGTTEFLAAIGSLDTIHSGQPSSLNESTLSVVVHHLGRSENIRIRNLGRSAELTIGLENITALLKNEFSKPFMRNAERSPEWLTAPNFELLPLADDKGGIKISGKSHSGSHPDPSEALNPAYSFTSSDETWGKPSGSGMDSSTIRCEIHPSGLPDHSLVETNSDSLTIGQLVVLSNARSLIQIGVIRWMQSIDANQYFYYGIEHLASRCSVANVFIASRKYADVLLVDNSPNGSAVHSIVMPPAKFPLGTRLTVRQPGMTKNLVIQKLLESAPFFCQYSLKQMHHAD